jgi:IS30 family transposase
LTINTNKLLELRNKLVIYLRYHSHWVANSNEYTDSHDRNYLPTWYSISNLTRQRYDKVTMQLKSRPGTQLSEKKPEVSFYDFQLLFITHEACD